MRETSFTVLTYANQYMDANRLKDGLYASAIPFLYYKGTTIENLVEQAEKVKEITGMELSDKYFEHLKMCTLTPITITIK